jgi:putative transposase
LKLEFSATFSWLGEERIRMKASRFTEAQKAFIVKQGEEGTPVAEICRKAGISQATYFNWRKRYGGLLPDEMRRLKALEDENGRLKKIVADLTLDREMVSPVNATGSSEQANGRHPPKARSPAGLNRWRPLAHPGRMRELVRGMCIDWGVSIRGACGALRFDTSTFHYKSRRTDQAAVERRIKEIAEI